jgi:hypothetical protein
MGHGQAAEGGRVGSERRGLEGETAARIAVEGEQQRVEPRSRIARIVVEERVEADAEVVEGERPRLPVVFGKRTEPLHRRGMEIGGDVHAVARVQVLVAVEHREVAPVVAGETMIGEEGAERIVLGRGDDGDVEVLPRGANQMGSARPQRAVSAHAVRDGRAGSVSLP